MKLTRLNESSLITGNAQAAYDKSNTSTRFDLIHDLISNINDETALKDKNIYDRIDFTSEATLKLLHCANVDNNLIMQLLEQSILKYGFKDDVNRFLKFIINVKASINVDQANIVYNAILNNEIQLSNIDWNNDNIWLYDARVYNGDPYKIKAVAFIKSSQASRYFDNPEEVYKAIIDIKSEETLKRKLAEFLSNDVEDLTTLKNYLYNMCKINDTPSLDYTSLGKDLLNGVMGSFNSFLKDNPESKSYFTKIVKIILALKSFEEIYRQEIPQTLIGAFLDKTQLNKLLMLDIDPSDEEDICKVVLLYLSKHKDELMSVLKNAVGSIK